MNDLVLKMLNAYTSGEYEDHQLMEKMTAAAKVLLEAALGEPELSEIGATDRGEKEQPRGFWHPSHTERLKLFLANRKARLLLAPKTIESRVTIEEVETTKGFSECLFVDGRQVKDRDILEYARKGLIAEMKEMG